MDCGLGKHPLTRLTDEAGKEWLFIASDTFCWRDRAARRSPGPNAAAPPCATISSKNTAAPLILKIVSEAALFSVQQLATVIAKSLSEKWPFGRASVSASPAFRLSSRDMWVRGDAHPPKFEFSSTL